MSTVNTQTATMLDLLVIESRDAAVGFRQAAAAATDGRLRALLSNFAQLRAQLAGELERALAGLDGRGSSAIAGRPAGEFSQDTSFASSRNCAATISDCRERDEQILKQYQWILKRDLSATLRQIVSRQFAAVQADYQRLGELVAALDVPSAAGVHSRASDGPGGG